MLHQKMDPRRFSPQRCWFHNQRREILSFQERFPLPPSSARPFPGAVHRSQLAMLRPPRLVFLRAFSPLRWRVLPLGPPAFGPSLSVGLLPSALPSLASSLRVPL